MQILNIENSMKFLTDLIRNMKNFGVKVNKNIIKQPDLTLDDVTIKAYEQINIEKLIDYSCKLEVIIQGSLEISNIKELMSCYQKVIFLIGKLNYLKLVFSLLYF